MSDLFGGNRGPQIFDMRYRSPEEWDREYAKQPDFGIDTHDIKYPQFGEPSPPGYQQPPGEQAPPQGQQDSQQYYQQMRQNIDGMNEAFKQIEQMQMPGGQYQGGGRGNYAGSKTGKGTANF